MAPLLLLCFLLHLAAAVSLKAPIWTQGTYTSLQVFSDASLILLSGSIYFTAAVPPIPPASFFISSGTGPWGGFEEVSFLSTTGELSYAVRYHAQVDAFTFTRSPNASAFPWFAAADAPSASAGVVYYEKGYMLPGGRFDSLSECSLPQQLQQPAKPVSGPPPGCTNLTGDWCCEPVSVVQNGTALSSTAAWGTGVGSVEGLSIAMNFSNVGPQTGALTADCNTIQWSPAGSTWARHSNDGRRPTDGPLFIFSKSPSTPTGALAFSPLDNFTVQSSACGGSAGFGVVGVASAPAPPTTQPLSSLLLGRPGLKRATVAWGALLRQAYNTTRRRATGSRALSYWSDNLAGYSFWSVPGDLSKWGQPEAIFSALYQGYKALGVPIVQWEIDSNFLAGTPSPWFGGWCWREWGVWNETLYPSGPNFSSNVLGGAPLALYVSAFCQDNVHRQNFTFVDVPGPHPAAVVHPDAAYAFYTSILAPAAATWHMQHFFTDFLCFRGPGIGAALPALYGAEVAWLRGMTAAASDLGMEVQYCMTCAHQALESLAWPAVTNARVNGDGGLYLPDLAFSTPLAAALGLGWSKDNLRLAVFAPGVTELQTILAALSMGPVGLSDELEGYPTPLVPPPAPTPRVITNVTLALSTCTTNGTLLQPSFPLTPVEELLAGTQGLDAQTAHVMATFTSVPSYTSPSSSTASGDSGVSNSNHSVWFTAVSYGIGGTYPPTFLLLPRHLAPLVDGCSSSSSGGGCSGVTNPPDFADIPPGAYLGDGSTFPSGSTYVSWSPGDTRAMPFDETRGIQAPLLPSTPAQFNFAPVLGVGGLVVLGEEGKVAAISSFRFAAVVPSAGGAEATVTLRGAPGEAVTLLYALAPEFSILRAQAVCSEVGMVTVTLPPPAPQTAGDTLQ